MLGTKIYKENVNEVQYIQCAEWCNNVGTATIEDKGDYYEVVEIVIPEPTAEEIQARLTQVVQNHMDSIVQERNYANIHTACSYATSTDHIFAAEGIACVKWRDAVWRKYFDILADVDVGTRALPTVEELLEELPVLEW